MTNKGNDFWFMFLYNMNINNGTWVSHRQVIVSGDQSASIHIDGPSANESFNLAGGSYNDQHEYGSNQLTVATPFAGGFHLTSSEDIYAYTRNYIEATHDVATLLPTTSLKTRYIVQDFPSQQYGGEVGFVATEDNTVLTMTVPCNISGTSITTGTTLTPTLQQGEAYLLLGVGSLSGMEVTSNGKPFAMFQGAWNPSVPENTGGRDHMYEQAIPVEYWGTDFIVVGASAQYGNNCIRITSSENGCTVTLDGVTQGTLNARQTLTLTKPASGAYHIVTTKPAMVALYLGSQTVSGGDPASVIIPPLDCGICQSHFVLHNTSQLNTHYINVVCDTGCCDALMLDGHPFSATSTIIENYIVFRIPTTAGYHFLENSQCPFVAYAYGVGYYEGYAFPLGFRLDVPIEDTIDYSDTVCQNHAYSNYGFSIDSLSTQTAGTIERWRYQIVGDTMHHYHLTLTILPASTGDTTALLLLGDTLFYYGDTLTTAGTFTHYLTATNGCDSIVTIHLNFTEYRFIDTVAFVDTVCQNEAYNNHGFVLESSETLTTGTLERWRSDTIGDTLRYCHLTLSVLPLSSSDTTAHIILGDTLFYQGDTLTIAGVYTYHFTAANGCDSLLTLHLHYEALSLTASAEGICPGESVTLTASGTHYAWWSATPPDAGVDAQQGSTTITVSPMQTTTYSLCAYDGGPVLALVTVGVEAPPELCVRLSRPFIDFDFPVVTFTDCSEGRAHSTWSFSDGIVIENTAARRQFHHPLPDSVEVTLQSCNRYNCCSDTAFYVKSLIRSVWFPNVFTPDEETNNRFGITTSFEIVKFELHIYNRQGLLVYHTEDPAAMWDGTRDGRPCPQGAYVYHWHVRDATDYVKNGTGTITLIR